MANVDGSNWTESEVQKHSSREGFIATHMADAGVYERHTPEQKEKALGLVYDMCVPPVEVVATKKK